MTPAPALAAPPAGSLGLLDWAVLIAYAVLLLATGYAFNRRSARDTGDYFLGGRRMPVWAVAVSVVATSLSAATFVGGPQQAYAGNLTYLASNIGMILAALLVAWLVIPALYRAAVATPYGLLESRMGPGARRGAAAAFLVGRVMASGARVYIIGIPAALILFGEPAATAANPAGLIPAWQIVAAIAVMTAVGIAYTLVGGVRSVIWTDVIQMGVFMLAIAGAIWLLLDRVPGGAPAAYHALAHAALDDTTSKLTLFDTSLDPRTTYSVISCVFGFALFGAAAYGLDQDLVQRMLTCRTSSRGAASVILANVASVPVVAMFMVVGLLLYVFYQRPDVMGPAAPDYQVYDSKRIFLSFILRELPPGLGGLMFAGLFAAGLSSLNSGLNSMSSTLVNDFYRELVPGRDEHHYLRVGRVGVVGWGLVLGAFAVVCVYWQRAGDQTLIDFALGVMIFAYAGLLGVFATAVLTKRGSQASAIAALIVGFLVILALSPNVLTLAIDTDPIAERHEWIAYAWRLAFVWKLAIGAALAMGVCLLGNSHRAAGARPASIAPMPPSMPSDRPHALPVPAGVTRVLLFGGTFDPPHEGHLALALAARDSLGPDAWVVFVPAARSPHKEDAPAASGDDRIAMLERAVASLPRCAVWDEEIRRGERTTPPSSSYWVDTLATARATAPERARLAFLIGSDQLLALPRWRQWHRLAELADPVVVLRRPHASVPALLDALRADPAWAGEDPDAWAPRVVQLPLIDISATAIRERLRAGDDAVPGIPPAVMDVIRERHLYAPPCTPGA